MLDDNKCLYVAFQLELCSILIRILIHLLEAHNLNLEHQCVQ